MVNKILPRLLPRLHERHVPCLHRQGQSGQRLLFVILAVMIRKVAIWSRIKSEATSDLKSRAERDLNVEPVKVRRFSIMGIRSTSIFDPRLKASWTIFASACAALILRAT